MKNIAFTILIVLLIALSISTTYIEVNVPTIAHVRAFTLTETLVTISSLKTITVITLTKPFDFALSLAPSAVEVAQGGTANYHILIAYSHPSYSGTVIDVQIVGLENVPGVTWQSTLGGDLTIYTSSMTPPGSYLVTVIGSAYGVVRKASAKLIVTATSTTGTTSTSTATPFDYSLTISPPTQTVEIGKTASYMVAVSILSGAASAGTVIPLALEGLPGDVQQSFSVTTGAPPFSSTLTLTPSASTSPGIYTFNVVASTYGVNKKATATLVVKEKAKERPSITLSAQVRENDVIAVLGSVSPPISGDDRLDITYTSPKGEKISHEVSLGGGGTFDDTLSATTPGTWMIIAEWKGNDDYLPASSSPASITVEAKKEGLATLLSNPLNLGLIILILAVVGLVAALMRRGKTPLPQQAPTPTNYCPNCGAALQPGKAFCPSCGKQVE